MQINLDEQAVFNTDGTVDQPGTRKKLDALVAQFAASRDGSNTKLEKELDKIFDSSATPGIQTTTLAVKLVMARGGDLDKDLPSVKKELKTFIESHPRFGTGVGRAGGIRRLSLKDAENAREHGIAPETTEESTQSAESAESAESESSDDEELVVVDVAAAE